MFTELRINYDKNSILNSCEVSSNDCHRFVDLILHGIVTLFDFLHRMSGTIRIGALHSRSFLSLTLEGNSKSKCIPQPWQRQREGEVSSFNTESYLAQPLSCDTIYERYFLSVFEFMGCTAQHNINRIILLIWSLHGAPIQWLARISCVNSH